MRTLFAFLTLCLVAVPAEAQDSAMDVFDDLIASFESGAEGVNDFTVVTESFTTYYRRMESDGVVLFEAATESSIGGMGIGNMTTTMGTDNPYAMREMFGQAATLGEPTTFDGVAVHVIEVDGSALPEAAGELHQMKLFVDSERSLLRGMRMMGEGENPGEVMEIIVHLEDYRDDDGILYPYRTRIEMPGADAEFDPEQLAQAREALAGLDENMANMPAAQREQIRNMMETSIERMEQMMAGGGLEMLIEVTELRVNTGIDPAKFGN